MTRVLLVEDEISLSEPLAFLLGKEGFDVTLASDGEEALRLFDEGSFDIVLLDLMLPHISGTEVCRHIRSTSSIPIIMVTAKDSEVDIVVGLELGADDFVTKPYKATELLARVRAVLRRTLATADSFRATDTRRGPEHDTSTALQIGRVRLDVDRHTLHIDGTLTPIPLKEFELLAYLMANAGRVLTRGQLIDRVWGSNYFGDTKTLDVHIKRIRGRIELDPAHPALLSTVRGLGYRFEN